MNDSILISLKEMLGVDESTTAFDSEIIVAANTAFMVLRHLGVTKDGAEYFYVTDDNETWSDFLGSNTDKFQSVKAYVYSRTKLAFDPPSTSSLIECLKEQIKELAFYLGVDGEDLD